MPALLRRKSICCESWGRVFSTSEASEEIELEEEVSHSRMWIFWEEEASFVSADEAPDCERTQARIVFEELCASWRVNSKPIPRLVPVIR